MAKHPTAGRELHVWDGTSVSLVDDLEPGPADAFQAIAPVGHQFAQFNDKLYMVAVPSTTFNTSPGTLWSYDGVDSIRQVIADPTGTYAIGVNHQQMQALGSKLYFGMNGISFGSQLCSYDPVTMTQP